MPAAGKQARRLADTKKCRIHTDAAFGACQKSIFDKLWDANREAGFAFEKERYVKYCSFFAQYFGIWD